MKKSLFFALLWGLMFINNNINAQVNKTPIVLVPTSTSSNPPTGNSGIDVPIISAEYDADNLTIFIENYAGDTDILIMRNFGHQVVYDSTDYLSPLSPVEIDIFGYSSGSYSIYIMLDCGEMYSGEFLIE